MSEVAISAIIITKDEEKNIARCLDSLKWVPEVVMVDSHSTDRTVEIASGYANVRVIDSDWLGYSATKRVAVAAAKSNHILWIDADEVVSQELATEIQRLSSADLKSNAAYDLPRKTFFMGDWVKYCGWYPGRVVRLFDRRRCDFNDNQLHEGVELNAGEQLGHLQHDLLHYSYTSLYQYFDKMNQYGSYGALELERKGKSIGAWRLVASPAFAFFKTYIMKRGVLDKNGLTISIGSAFSNFIKFTNYYYMKKGQGKASKILGRVPKRIIISRTDNIGDVILTLPLAGILKKRFPEVEIIFLGKKYTQPIIDSCTHVDRFLSFEELESEPVRVLRELKADVIVHVYPNRLVAKAAKDADIPVRIGTSHRPFHLISCNISPNLGRKRSNLHESQLNAKLLESLGITAEIPLSEIKTSYGMQPTVQLPGTVDIENESRFKIIFHPRSKGSAAEWPLSYYLELAKMLDEKKFKIYVTGTENEGAQIKNECTELLVLPHVEDMTGRLTLSELITFISMTDGLLACSTGPLHIASAMGVRALGLYVPIRPIHAGRWAPVGEKAEVMIGEEKNGSGNLSPEESISSISVRRVKERLEQWANEKA